ncbi:MULTISPECIES: IS21-like element helper ATPase IstB [Leptolyngbya]|uniref:IS21-like element helper ATPase IstB n=1 Tax=Leptolyngbya TaxID=47251 RepID=UPI0024114209|nr:IS21-like element helper ATPase IstB [Leptolyngbya sp. FACHB-1624]
MRLSHMLTGWQHLEQKATQEQWSYAQFLLALCELETEKRSQTRIARAISEAQLPAAKSFSNFEFGHCSKLNPATLKQLAEDPGWVERTENLLLFGASGVGKTHLASAVGRSLIELGKRVKFSTATALVQVLQHAKQNLQLPAALTKLDRYDLLIVDDLGYVKKTEAETSVLFELIAHRYERGSLLITANQPFSQWDEIFCDSMMTVAAVDRLVHHALILDIQAESFRRQTADKRSKAK